MKFALIGIGFAAASAFATPALAQAVIEDPGYCAQFYPNANCENLGPGNPYTDGGYYRSGQNAFARCQIMRRGRPGPTAMPSPIAIMVDRKKTSEGKFSGSDLDALAV